MYFKPSAFFRLSNRNFLLSSRMQHFLTKYSPIQSFWFKFPIAESTAIVMQKTLQWTDVNTIDIYHYSTSLDPFQYCRYPAIYVQNNQVVCTSQVLQLNTFKFSQHQFINSVRLSLPASSHWNKVSIRTVRFTLISFVCVFILRSWSKINSKKENTVWDRISFVIPCVLVESNCAKRCMRYHQVFCCSQF